MMIMTPTRQNYKQGDVVLVLFPNTNLRTAKRRPALIIQANNLETGLAQVIVAMITSNLARANHPSRIDIRRNSREGHQSGLLSDSVVMTDNLATIHEQGIYRVIGSLPLDNIKKALKHTFGL